MTEEETDADLESLQFREALLGRLNGQSDELQRLVKLVDTRFLSQSRRQRETRQEIREHGALHVTEGKRMERRILAALLAAPAAFVAIAQFAAPVTQALVERIR
jgi:hypothetical protein